MEKLIIRKSLEKKTLKEEWTMQGKQKQKQNSMQTACAVNRGATERIKGICSLGSYRRILL